jgi:uncharacterized membrane protein YfcA
MTARLVLIGLVAGVFSALFGVGGGTIIVPLLIGAVAFSPHVAAATSLGAILVTALAGVTLYALRGEVDVAYAALVGIPAMAGALIGTHLQQRITGRALTLAFSGFLVCIAIWLIVG